GRITTSGTAANSSGAVAKVAKPYLPEHAPCELQVFPCLALVARISQQVSRMIRHYERRIQLTKMVHLAPESSKRHVRRQQVLGRDAPHGENQPRPHQGDLPHQVRQAGGDRLRLRIPNTRRAALQDIGDKDIRFTAQADGLQHGIQELSRAAHEGLTAAVFLGTRCLADHQPVRLRISDAEYALRAARVQGATCTGGNLGTQSFPLSGHIGGQGYRRSSRGWSWLLGSIWGPLRRRRDTPPRHPNVDPDDLQVLVTALSVHYVPRGVVPRRARRMRRASHRVGADKA